MKSGYLHLHNTYKFSLIVNSKINKFVSDQTSQIIKIMEMPQLSIDLKCLRNCMRNLFIAGDIIHLQAVTLGKALSNTATFQWFLHKQTIGNLEHLVYETQQDSKTLLIHVLVQDQALSGKAQQTYEVNLAPYNGSCSIEPTVGEAFFTNFHIKCQNYVDTDTPLNYEYLQENEFPLQRTNEADIHIKLAQCSKVIIKICDQFQACFENHIKVEVKALEAVKDVGIFIQSKEVGFKQLFLKGDILTAMILLKSLSKSIKTIKDLEIIEKEMDVYEVKTLIEIEQFLEISKILLTNNLPLTSAKANIFNKYILKLHKGFKRIHKDAELVTFKRLSYEKCSQELLQIMQYFAQTWETIIPVQVIPAAAVTFSNPLQEIYPILEDFNINIAEQLQNWLKSSKNLMDCFNFMLEGAKELYTPWEQMFSLEKNNFYLKVWAFDNSSEQEIEINNKQIKVLLNEAFIKELQENFQNTNILLQMASLNSNPFWWFPSENPLSTEVFFFTAHLRVQPIRSQYTRI
ncbi:uncharacterized protein LOC124420240 [Lucilia cuprina]|uniref:uncharacterized protein LOC124420240 n=1 Tax=Lucilia cuprina TaxID=7375 RepID=UPI001F05BEF2|nr:uncharacterized protein LOC124420240 [Lucilia cuprina]